MQAMGRRTDPAFIPPLYKTKGVKGLVTYYCEGFPKRVGTALYETELNECEELGCQKTLSAVADLFLQRLYARRDAYVVMKDMRNILRGAQGALQAKPSVNEVHNNERVRASDFRNRNPEVGVEDEDQSSEGNDSDEGHEGQSEVPKQSLGALRVKTGVVGTRTGDRGRA